jgi:hypothetical protein
VLANKKKTSKRSLLKIGYTTKTRQTRVSALKKKTPGSCQISLKKCKKR